MIGAKRMNNVRSECERVLKASVPGDFMETGVWRGGACIMMRAVLKAYGITDRRVIAADSFAGFPPPSAGVAADADFPPSRLTRISPCRSAEVKAAFARYGLLDDQVVFLRRAVQGHAAGRAGRAPRRAAARRRHVREHAWTASSTSTTSFPQAAR